MTPTRVGAADASRCAAFLQQHWRDGALTLPNRQTVHGYSSYSKTLGAHDPAQQRSHTLLFTHTLLPAARNHVRGRCHSLLPSLYTPPRVCLFFSSLAAQRATAHSWQVPGFAAMEAALAAWMHAQ